MSYLRERLKHGKRSWLLVKGQINQLHRKKENGLTCRVSIILFCFKQLLFRLTLICGFVSMNLYCLKIISIRCKCCYHVLIACMMWFIRYTCVLSYSIHSRARKKGSLLVKCYYVVVVLAGVRKVLLLGLKCLDFWLVRQDNWITWYRPSQWWRFLDLALFLD